jgi:hypothetical protein
MWRILHWCLRPSRGVLRPVVGVLRPQAGVLRPTKNLLNLFQRVFCLVQGVLRQNTLGSCVFGVHRPLPILLANKV